MKKIKHIAIDSMILIYYLEDDHVFANRIEELLGKTELITLSTIGLGEILAGFEKNDDQEGKLKFLSFVESYKKLKLINFNKNEALTFAQLRAKYPSIKPPDAIHLATAISSGADAFFTNDKKLEQIEEIPVLLLQK